MIYYIQTGIFSLSLLVLVYLNIRSNPNKHRLDYQLFFILVFTTFCAILLDVGMILVDGRPGWLGFQGNYLITCLYYIFNPLPCFVWTLFCDVLIFNDAARLRRRLWPLTLPVFLVALLSVSSFFSPRLFFYVDAQHFYHRGPLFLVMALLCYFYLIYAFIIVLVNRSRISRRDFVPLIFFAIPPTIGGIIQSLFYGTSILWMSVAFSILVIYTNIQNVTLSTDHLTGLFNRRQLDAYLDHIQKTASGGQRIAGMMIDLNDLKQINDRLGHKAGDQALEQTALILKESLRRDDFIARYGGDEFAVVLRLENKDMLQKAISRIESRLEQFNRKQEHPFFLSFSIGYDFYDPQIDRSTDDFIRRIDKIMYDAKQQHHAKSSGKVHL